MLTLFDIVILTIIALSSLMGAYKGFTKITINLIGIIASIAFAIFIYPYAKTLLSEYIGNKLVTSVVSGIASYIISLIIFTFLTSKIILLFCGISGGVVDRSLGLIIGIVRGLLFSLVVFSIVAILSSVSYKEVKLSEDLVQNLSSEKYPSWLSSSVTSPYLEDILKCFVENIPQKVSRSIDSLMWNKEEGDDIIDSIKRRKEGGVFSPDVVSSSVQE